MKNDQEQANGAFLLPSFAQNLKGLNEKEITFVEAILHKAPGESWEKVAKTLGVSRRTLFAYRQDPRLQEALLSVTLDILKTELVDVIKAVAQKAKQGHVGAAKVILEYADRAWNIEQRFNTQLNSIKEALFRALDRVSPEISERLEHELEQIELEKGTRARAEGEGRGKALLQTTEHQSVGKSERE
jgi:nitrogen regulatory protein PII